MLVGGDASGPVVGLAPSPSDSRLVSCARGEKAVRVWDAGTSECVTTLRHDDDVLAVAFTADGERVVSACGDGVVRMWDLASGTCVATVGCDAVACSLAVAADGRRIAAGLASGALRLFDSGLTRVVGTAEATPVYLTATGLHYVAHGRRLVCNMGDCVRLFDVPSESFIGELAGSGDVTCVAATGSGSLVAFGCGTSAPR